MTLTIYTQVEHCHVYTYRSDIMSPDFYSLHLRVRVRLSRVPNEVPYVDPTCCRNHRPSHSRSRHICNNVKQHE